MQINKTFLHYLFIYFLCLVPISLLYYIFLWKNIANITTIFLSKYLSFFGISNKYFENTLVIKLNNTYYYFEISKECTCIDICIIFAISFLFYHTKKEKKILAIIGFILFGFIFNIIRLGVTSYFLTVSFDKFLIAHQFIFKSINFIILPTLYIIWYSWMKK